MIINKTEIGKFSLPEALSDSNGKTSGSKLAAFEVITIGCVCLLIASVNIVAGGENGVALAGILAGLITAAMALFGYSKKLAPKDTTNTNLIEENNNGID